MNRTIKIVISVVLCVWIFAMGLELGAFRERRAINATLNGNPTPTVTNPVPNTQSTSTPAPQTQPSEAPTQQDSTQPSEAPTQQGESQTQPSESTTEKNPDVPATDVTAEKTTAPTEKSGSDIPKTTDEIVAAFNKAMNETKHTTRNCNAKKSSNVEVTVTDCSVKALTGMVNNIVSGFTGPEEAEYSFVGGKAQGPDGEVTLFGDFPPSGRDTTLEAAGVSKASAEKYGDGGYTLSITLVSETSSLGNEPKYHANSVGFLDLEGLGISGVTFTKADFTYPGATVTISVNKDGLVDKYDCTLPMSGTGEASVKIASGSATLEGSSSEQWTFTWL